VGFPAGVTVKTAKEGRLLAEQTLNVACVDFETRLSALTVSGVTFAFSSELEGYVLDNIPSQDVTIGYTPLNSAATVHISGVGATGILPVSGSTASLEVLNNTVTVRVEAAHGAASREYKLYLTRNQSSTSREITAFSFFTGTECCPPR
jgi:hypothetical protein